MSVGPLLQSLGRQHLNSTAIPLTDATLHVAILVPVSLPVLSIHCIGDELLVHGLPSGNSHPPSLVLSSASLCIHHTLLSMLLLGRKYDPLG